MMDISSIRTYKEMIAKHTYEERFRYLMLNGRVGEDTFGFDRYLNQKFYKSVEWKELRNKIILRDNGCDLAMKDYDIHGKIIIHHMNPISPTDLRFCTDFLLNPDYLVCVSFDTHQAIHYGDESYLNRFVCVDRKENDTCPWR